jgi:hypothetical protein
MKIERRILTTDHTNHTDEEKNFFDFFAVKNLEVVKL